MEERRGSLRLLPLDSLRGIAAFGVAFFWHYKHFLTNDTSVYPFFNFGYWFYTYGWNLVDLFFVLSGFVFMHKYLIRIINNEISFKEFSILRLTRLYPLHFITLGVVLVFQYGRYAVLGSFFNYQYNDIYHFLLNIFLLQSNLNLESGYSFNAPSWSICSEVIAYLAFFVILFRYNKKYLFPFVVTVVVSAIIIKSSIAMPLLNNYTARALLGFFVGCLTFKINEYIANNKELVYFCFLFLAINIFSAVMLGLNIFGNWPIVWVVLIYPLIIISILNVKPLKFIFSLKILVFLGTISYSIYLWHFPVQLIIKTFDDVFSMGIRYESIKIYLAVVSITLIISYISYEYFEKKWMYILRKKYINKK